MRQTAEEPWDWKELSANTFPYEKEMFFFKRMKRYMAAYRIQQWWFKISLSPRYRIGRKLIEKRRMEIMMDIKDDYS